MKMSSCGHIQQPKCSARGGNILVVGYCLKPSFGLQKNDFLVFVTPKIHVFVAKTMFLRTRDDGTYLRPHYIDDENVTMQNLSSGDYLKDRLLTFSCLKNV